MRNERRVVIVCSILFSLLTVYFQEQALGLYYLEAGTQLERHRAVLEGTAPNAWQYRVLSEYLTEGLIVVLNKLGVPHPVAVAFLSFRLLQNWLIFVVAALYYRKLGLNLHVVLIGLSVLAWGMTHALFNSDLQFSNYSEVIFYLAAGLAILARKDQWIIPITLLAAVNRETCGAIPFMLLAARAQLTPAFHVPRRSVVIFLVASSIYGVAFVGLRYVYGLDRPLSGPLGLQFFLSHVFSYKAWAQMFATLGILPFIAIVTYRRWPPTLKAILWAVVPLWFVIIPLGGGLMETRHYLVPQALVFIPGALLGATALRVTGKSGPARKPGG